MSLIRVKVQLSIVLNFISIKQIVDVVERGSVKDLSVKNDGVQIGMESKQSLEGRQVFIDEI